MGNWQMVLLEPAKVVLSQIGQFLTNVVLVIVILIIGWVISKFIKNIVIRILQAIKIDRLSDRIELNNLLAKGGIQYSLSELMGIVCYWLAILITFVVAINAIGLTIAADLLNKIVLYIPNVIAAVFILILGMFIAALLKNIVKAAAINAGIAQANLLGKVVDITIIVFAVALALEQLNIGPKIIQLIVGIVLGSLGLAVALAFGLGCKGMAEKYLSDFADKIKSKK